MTPSGAPGLQASSSSPPALRAPHEESAASRRRRELASAIKEVEAALKATAPVRPLLRALDGNVDDLPPDLLPPPPGMHSKAPGASAGTTTWGLPGGPRCKARSVRPLSSLVIFGVGWSRRYRRTLQPPAWQSSSPGSTKQRPRKQHPWWRSATDLGWGGVGVEPVSGRCYPHGTPKPALQSSRWRGVVGS